MSFHGHYWTLRQYFQGFAESAVVDGLLPFQHTESTGAAHSRRLSGVWLPTASKSELLVVLHGLGGSIASRYMPRAARVARSAGVACLLLNARGAGNAGDGIAHAGLIDDLDLALRSELLAHYRDVYLLGYSMGGHVALRYASLKPDPRLRASVAACSPLDLQMSMRAFDAPRVSVYRKHVVGALVAGFERWSRNAPVPVALSRVRSIRGIFDWDQYVVAPVFGFDSAFHYYECMSAARCLGDLGVPSLYVGARHDPMVPPHTVTNALLAGSKLLHVHWSEVGGHLAFPKDFQLGFATSTGFEAQCLAWLRQYRTG